MEQALGRVPALENVGVKQLLNGPESFTPDGNFILGEAPELEELLRRRRLQRLRHRLGRRRRHGACRVGRKGRAALRPLAGRYPRFGRPHFDTDWVRTRTLRGLRQALYDGLALRGALERPALPQVAALRPAEGAGRLLRRKARLGAAELVRRSVFQRGAKGYLQLRPPELVRRRRPRARPCARQP
jgi:hypothetical protein